MFYKHVFALRRNEPEGTLIVSMFKSFPWPGHLDDQPPDEEIEDMRLEGVLLGDREEYDDDPVDKEEVMEVVRVKNVPGALQSMSLRCRIDPPIRGTLLCVNSHTELTMKDVEHHVQHNVEDLRHFIQSARISI
jgi:hypothetical protein